MELTHEFTIHQPQEEVWSTLIDLPAVANAIPGATIEDVSEDGSHTGLFRIKLGSLTATFRGKARYTFVDPATQHFILEGTGASAQGNATLRVSGETSSDDGNKTTVKLTSSVELTGKVAQFGSSIADDVTNRILDEFVTNITRGFDAGHNSYGTQSVHTPADSANNNDAPFDLGSALAPTITRGKVVVALVLIGGLIGIAIYRATRPTTT